MKKKYLRRFLSGFVIFSSFLLPAASDVYGSPLTADDILSMSIEDMLAMTITTATKKEETVAEVPASSVVVSREEIERYGYTSLKEILQNVPGMYQIDDNVYRETFGVRGYWTGYPRNILIMVNGVAFKDGSFGYSLLSYLNIPVIAIDRIEVVRGPLSVMYGHGAFFGAINIITDHSLHSGDEDSSYGIASVSYGSLESKEVAFRGDLRKGDFNLSLNTSYAASDGPDEPMTRMHPSPSTLPGIDSDAQTTDDDLRRDSKNLNFSTEYRGFYFKGNLTKSDTGLYTFLPSVGEGSIYDRDYRALTAGYRQRYSDFFTIDGRVNYQKFDFQVDWRIIDTVLSQNDYTRGDTETYEFELDTHFTFSEELSLTCGLFFQQIDVIYGTNLSVFGSYREVSYADPVTNWGFFSQVDYNPLDKLKLVAGLRFEQAGSHDIKHVNNPGRSTETLATYETDDYDLEAIPRLAVIYSIDDQSVVKFLYGKAISRPSAFQVNDNLIAEMDAPEAEEIETYELNYSTTIGNKMNISGSIFRNRLENLMVRSVALVDGEDYSYFNNTGELITNGCELTLRAEPFLNFTTELSLTYQDTEDQRDGFGDREPSHSPQWLGYLKAAYRFENNISLAATGRYVDEMEAGWNDSTNRRIGEKSDDYFLLDVNFRADDIAGKKGVYFNLRINNLFDEKYQYPTTTTNTWQTQGSIGDGRVIMATVGYKF